MKVKKAVIPAAGLGTRMLPASKAVPKEMINLVDKPAIQYIVEEIVESGITDILIITGRGKTVMEDHFDYTPELEGRLKAARRERDYDAMRAISDMADISYIRQKEAKGLGHAVYCARSFVGDEPFALLLGDDIVYNSPPATAQLAAAFYESGMSIIGVQKVKREEISRYGCILPSEQSGSVMRVLDMEEKPQPERAFSLYAAMGRYLLTAEVFDMLRDTRPGVGGEIQLTDALRAMALKGRLSACDFAGRRYDTGSKLGYLEAVVEYALRHGEVGESFRAYLKDICRNL